MVAKKRTSQRTSTKTPPSGTLSLVLAFLIGYAVAHVFDINFIGRQLDHVMIENKQPAIQQAQTKVTLPKPKFEYYALLQKEGAANNPSNHSDKKQSTIEVREANPLAPIRQDNHTYILQLASYFKKEDAERMKAELILQGRQASIQEHKSDNRTIYRLVVGPFKRKTEAEKEQVDLARQLHVMGMIRQTQLS
ncbi:SPOR domain-containing protein [Legionella sp. W05-934-2]|jgi:cell division protein FtsN|uniref:SPOR domain-containing protein n=1 Tax=Legionella sp. W05-934-2 TaxID=1198649 RepID=UPI003461A55D